MYDIIFCSIPYSDLDHVYSAPAILKGVAVTNNYQARTIDFGITLLELCDRNVDLFAQIQNYFISPGNPLDQTQSNILDQFYKKVLKFFQDNPSTYIGISILSIYTHKSAFDIIRMLKENQIPAKIIVGGRGAKVPFYEITCSGLGLTKLDRTISYGEFLKKKNLVDHVVIGDGEDAILSILRNENTEIKDNRTDTFKYPLPDYTNYEFDKYLYHNEISFPITGSKGCVRDCDFCDIRFQFGKYRYRNGKDIANEMMYIAGNFGFSKFQFTDSLVNGGLKSLEEFCTIIADYNSSHPQKQIRWTGQYICRPETQMPKRLYKLMADSGAEGLTIGAESGSNHVLEMMNKKTTVEALYSELEQFRQHGLTCVLLTFVGHWSETFEDFIDHCKMFIKILPYVRSGTISSVQAGLPALILDGTPGMRDVEKFQISLDEELSHYIWTSKLNPTNNFKERIFRRLIISKLVNKLKIPCNDEFIQLLQMSSMIDLQHEHINGFHEKFYKQNVQ